MNLIAYTFFLDILLMIIDNLPYFTLLIVTLCKEEKRHVGITYPKHLCASVCVCVNVSMGGCVEASDCLPQSLYTLLFKTRSLVEPGVLSVQEANWVASKPQGSPCLFLHSVDVIGTQCCTNFLHVHWGIQAPLIVCLASALGLLRLPSFPKGCALRL